MNFLKQLCTLIGILSLNLTFANHDEAVDGDLSGDPQNPTVIQIVDGSNVVCASSIAGDVEFFTITVPPGATLDEIVLTSFVSPSVAFLAFQAGTVADPSVGVPGLLGWTHLGQVSGAQLAELNSNGGIGFTIPLGPGDYTFWSQETSSVAPSDYCLDFQITLPPPIDTSIPTMGEWSLISLALILLILNVSRIKSYEQNKKVDYSQ